MSKKRVDVENTYAEDRDIDEKALDVEWLDHSRIAYKWGKIHADVKYLLEKAVENKKIIRSELIVYVNRNPKEATGKDKPNAADIEAFYRTDKQYQAAVQDVIELTRELAYAEVAKNEICFTRKKALENLVILHGQQYFAGPRVPRNLTEERKKHKQPNWKEIDKEVNSKIRIGKNKMERNK